MTANPEQPVLDEIDALVEWQIEEGHKRGEPELPEPMDMAAIVIAHLQADPRFRDIPMCTELRTPWELRADAASDPARREMEELGFTPPDGSSSNQETAP